MIEPLLNKVHNVDCFELLGKLPDESIDLVVTDPPYNMGYSGRGKINEFDGFANDKLTPEQHTEWFDDVLAELYRVLKNNTAIYIFIDFRNYARLYGIVDKYFDIKNCIVWDKTSIGMGQCYRFQHEFIIYAHKGKPKLNFIKRNVSDVWHIKRANTRQYKHPTQKPVEVMALPVRYSSDAGNVVLDPFLGSGSLAVVCKDLGRHFIGAEIDKQYCEITETRLEKEICHQSDPIQTCLGLERKMDDGKMVSHLTTVVV